jgi:hypothetical protein
MTCHVRIWSLNHSKVTTVDASEQAPLNDAALAALRRIVPADVANSTRAAVCAALRATHERQRQRQRGGQWGGAMVALSEEDAEKRIRTLADRVWGKKVRNAMTQVSDH